MSPHGKRGPQALTADRRQARPMALRGAAAPIAATATVRGERSAVDARRHAGEPGSRAPGRTVLAEPEPAVARCLGAIAAVGRRCRRPARPGVVYSDERSTADAAAALRRHELAPRLRDALGLDSDDDAEALLALDLEWLRYPRPEETADVAALLPLDPHELAVRVPLLRRPRWRRLGVGPP